jgi:hypothetical protein
VSRLSWGSVSKRTYETGIDRGVLYPNGGPGVAWDGLISVSENPTGGESTPFYIDGYKYHEKSAPEEFRANIEAYTYPDEFEVCNGTQSLGSGLYITQQRRVPFGLCYRTRVGNPVDGDDHGYKLHLVYNALAAPTNKNYSTVDDSPDPLAFNWAITTKPVKTPGHRPTPQMIVDSTKVTAPLLKAIEDILYGTTDDAPRLPSPTEIISLFGGWPTLQVVDNGDGTFTIYGPDDVVRLLDATTFQITSETVVNNGDGSFDVTSY